MAASESYRTFVLEQLQRVTPVTARAMFGGVGIYAEGLFFALIAEDRLYFKVDDSTRPAFEALGMEPFRPFEDENAMGYYEVPADILEDVNQLASWVRQAIDVAARAKTAKRFAKIRVKTNTSLVGSNSQKIASRKGRQGRKERRKSLGV